MDGVWLYQHSQKPACWPNSWAIYLVLLGWFLFFWFWGVVFFVCFDFILFFFLTTCSTSLSRTLRADDNDMMLQVKILPRSGLHPGLVAFVSEKRKNERRCFFLLFLRGEGKEWNRGKKRAWKISYHFFEYVFSKDWRLQKHFSQIYFCIFL